MQPIAIIDFETTGISPNMGDRATEVAIVLLQEGQVVDRYQSLMNAGVRVNSFITQLTGITNEMLQAAPAAEQVMREAARFVGDLPMVAHNAAFDKKFWQAELARCGQDGSHAFACTLLLSRRLYPQAPNHKLGTLAALHHLPSSGRAHRALADAEMAAHLLAQMQHDLKTRFGCTQVDHALMMGLQRTSRHMVSSYLKQRAGR
ncbi:MAG: PolC-type DNA polymerase III [Limnohabitans sp.]|jgi:DNA polymerase-3 subunit epsilon